MSDKRYDGENKDLPQRLSPYPQSRLAAPHDLVGLAEEIERADSTLRTVVTGKIEHIARQMRALKEEAERTLRAAERDAELHRVPCSFRKRPGERYYLYERPNGQRYFSMLSPEEWGDPPHRYCGGFRLEVDMSFTAVEEIASLDEEREQLRRLLR